MERTDFSPLPGPARIAPITPEEWTDEVRAFFDFVEGPKGRQNGSKLNVILTLARHPDLAMKYFAFGMQILRFSTLDPRLRELVTLRTAWLCDSEYEWEKHEKTALKVGMTPAEIAAVKRGEDQPIWSEFDRAAIRATDQLCKTFTIDDPTWKVLARHLDSRELLDLVFTIGSYVMLAMVLNAVHVQLETP